MSLPPKKLVTFTTKNFSIKGGHVACLCYLDVQIQSHDQTTNYLLGHLEVPTASLA